MLTAILKRVFTDVVESIPLKTLLLSLTFLLYFGFALFAIIMLSSKCYRDIQLEYNLERIFYSSSLVALRYCLEVQLQNCIEVFLYHCKL